ncbi:hypothetical protein niasHT_002079 [Heterodera trifolii]|uniref:Uncharacterized protein n=1 Tax=Heterodera trifolii TaxID=157864 RepID=A0ABD2LXB9_9BILA
MREKQQRLITLNDLCVDMGHFMDFVGGNSDDRPFPSDRTIWTNQFEKTEFEKAGAVASADISLTAGQMPAELHLHGAMEPQLRKLGMPTRLENDYIFKIFRRASTNISLPAGPMPGGIALARRHGSEVAKVGHGHTAGKCRYNLLEEFNVCKTDDQLSADQARILKQFGQRLAQFCVRLLAR